jgi:hypothetical protein
MIGKWSPAELHLKPLFFFFRLYLAQAGLKLKILLPLPP